MKTYCSIQTAVVRNKLIKANRESVGSMNNLSSSACGFSWVAGGWRGDRELDR